MKQITNAILTNIKSHHMENIFNQSFILAITNQQGIIQFANERFCALTQYKYEELVGSTYQMINSGFHTYKFFKDMWNTLESGDVWRGEIRNKAKDHSYYWVDTTIIPVVNEDGKAYQYLSIQQDITKRKEHEQKLENMAYIDSLTKIPNQNYLQEWTKKQLDKQFTVFFIDIDQFKAINDNFGYEAGNEVLITMAHRMKQCLSTDDFIARFTGEEFIIFLENKLVEDSHALLRNILQVVQKPIYLHHRAIHITASIGVATGETPTNIEKTVKEIDRLIGKAHRAMFYAKRQGGNKYHLNSEYQDIQMEKTFQMELEVRNALERDEFHLVYQPLINLSNYKIVGVESLLRWENQLLGNIPPNEFIPLLEEKRYIHSVGRWVLQSVCQQMKKWQSQGLYLQRISVNVSPVQFKEKTFASELKQIFQETGLDPTYLEIEITESTLFDIDHAMETLNELQKIGVKVSIDDFGTGYSSLSYLKQLPIDTLKIDKSFIDNLDYDGEVIVNTIINMGKNLKFRVIAEGIENKEQLLYLQQQACHEGQGYYFSKPVHSNKIEELFTSH